MYAWKARIGQKGTDRKRTVDWTKPLRWNNYQICAECQTQVLVGHQHICKALNPDNFTFSDEVNWQKIKVFPSLCDWLDDKVPIEWLADFLLLMYRTPNLIWLDLTKRPENALDHLAKALKWAVLHAGHYMEPPGFIDWLDAWHEGHPPKNVWIGVSIENQKYADERRPFFEAIPAVKKFVSYEPALGPVNWQGWEFVHQIIFGGESGNKRRNCEIDWAGSTQAFCLANQIAFFCKQDSHRLPGQQGRLPDHIWNMKQLPTPDRCHLAPPPPSPPTHCSTGGSPAPTGSCSSR